MERDGYDHQRASDGRRVRPLKKTQKGKIAAYEYTFKGVSPLT
jgi:hypothetical protein